MARRIASLGRVTVSERRSTAPCRGPPRACEWWGAGGPLTTQHLRDQERELEGLAGVQPGVAGGLVPAVEVRVADVLGAAEALGDVLAGQLDVDAARPGAQRAVHVEEAEDLVDDAVEVAGLVAGRKLPGVGGPPGGPPHHPVAPRRGPLPPPPPGRAAPLPFP